MRRTVRNKEYFDSSKKFMIMVIIYIIKIEDIQIKEL